MRLAQSTLFCVLAICPAYALSSSSSGGDTTGDGLFTRLCSALVACSENLSKTREYQAPFDHGIQMFRSLFRYPGPEKNFPFRDVLNKFSNDFSDKILRSDGLLDDDLCDAFKFLGKQLVAVCDLVNKMLPSRLRSRRPPYGFFRWQIEDRCDNLSNLFGDALVWRVGRKVLKSRKFQVGAVLASISLLCVWKRKDICKFFAAFVDAGGFFKRADRAANAIGRFFRKLKFWKR